MSAPAGRGVLVVLPGLAEEVGLNKAILIRQLHYWHEKGSDWIYNTIPQWREQFPFWSESTIKRGLDKLREEGIVKVDQPAGQNRTNHYQLDYERLREKAPSGHSELFKGSDRSVEEVNLTRSLHNRDSTKTSTEKSCLSQAGGGSIPSEDVQEVWKFYDSLLKPKKAKLDEEQTLVIEGALEVASKEECCSAIRGLSRSDFHTKSGEYADRRGPKYTALKYALEGRGDKSTREQIDSMIQVANEYEPEDFFAGTEFAQEHTGVFAGAL